MILDRQVVALCYVLERKKGPELQYTFCTHIIKSILFYSHYNQSELQAATGGQQGFQNYWAGDISEVTVSANIDSDRSNSQSLRIMGNCCKGPVYPQVNNARIETSVKVKREFPKPCSQKQWIVRDESSGYGKYSGIESLFDTIDCILYVS